MRAGLVLLLAASLFAILVGAGPSAPKVVHEDAFWVMGIEVRTNNAKEATSEGLIGRQWQKFFQDGVLEKIPNKTGGYIYAVYSDYASDHNGDYSFLIGAKVADGSKAPADFVLKKVPGGNYAVVPTEKGPIAKVVSEAWQRIWAMEDKRELGGPRAYKVDYELHDQRSADPQNALVDIYIGLK